MSKIHCYFNGNIIPKNKIKISPYDLGFLRGYGVFDVMCTQNGKPFLLDQHWKRFQRSAKELGLKIPLSKKNFKVIIVRLLKLNSFNESIIRTILTGGVSKDAFSPAKETFCILIEKFKPLPPAYYTEGVGVMTLDYKREFPHAKITNYVAAIKNHNNKTKNGSVEIVYMKDGKVLEASTSNFFIFKGKSLITTKSDILFGVTRNLVIKLARKNGYVVKERDINIKELFSADEFFLTASNKNILPVVKVDGKMIGDGKVGKRTKDLIGIFKKFIEKY